MMWKRESRRGRERQRKKTTDGKIRDTRDRRINIRELGRKGVYIIKQPPPYFS